MGETPAPAEHADSNAAKRLAATRAAAGALRLGRPDIPCIVLPSARARFRVIFVIAIFPGLEARLWETVVGAGAYGLTITCKVTPFFEASVTVTMHVPGAMPVIEKL